MENGFQVWEIRWLQERTPGEGEEWGQIGGAIYREGRKARSLVLTYAFQRRCGPDCPFAHSAPSAPNSSALHCGR